MDSIKSALLYRVMSVSQPHLYHYVKIGLNMSQNKHTKNYIAYLNFLDFSCVKVLLNLKRENHLPVHV
jgi:hypothetical protein